MFAYKVEIEPVKKQKVKIHKGIGVCRFLYNAYIKHNEEVYEREGKFVSHMEFAKYVNHTLRADKPWINTCHSKARKKALANAETAFLKFFKGKAKYPKLKKKGKQDVKIYLPKNNEKDFVIERHRAKIPFLGWVRLKEKGYVPQGTDISSCTISQKGDRYFISFLVKSDRKETKQTLSKKGIGIDVGLKNFATTSDGNVFGNINKSRKVRRLEVTIERAQSSLARKLESNKVRKKQNNIHPSEYGANIKKAIVRIQNLHRRLANIRWSYTKSVVNEVVKTKPLYITIEDLNVRGMMQNKHLSRVIASQNFYRFRVWLEQACRKGKIELRMVDRFYPSSKLCSNCGTKKTNLSLSERTFVCEHCGTNLDRDYNASLNLENAILYKVLVG
ncbi:RNA-guided endonuclease InsQ/TnpB family protein [Neobacillus vireti]|uniref:RNA-guided endonuclease InsQ/TnpB family protein n=1 Tax=Neobacillus vireti TaxID=220686 RepID=UPI003B58A091